MSDISPINHHAAALARIAARQTTHQPVTVPAQRGGDTIDLSPTAHLLTRLAEMPDVRENLVARVRAEITAGTYETPEKLGAAVQAMIDDLG